MFKPTRIVACLALVAASGARAEREVSVEDWRADLEVFRTIVLKQHVDPFHSTPESEFHNAVTELSERIPELTDAQVLLEIQRIVASIKDGHSGVFWFLQGTWFHAMPLHLYYFDDGVFILRAMPPNEALERGRIDAIGGRPIEEVWDKVIAYQQHDNPWFAKAYGTSLLVNAELLHHLGIAEDTSSISVTVEQEGRAETIEIDTVSWPNYMNWRNDVPVEENPPLYRTGQSTSYWFADIPEHDAVYVRFNRVVQTRETPIWLLGQRLIERFEERGAALAIIDVRGNGGGDGNTLRRVLNDLEAHSAINTRGNLFVITDRETFSAAMMFVTRMAHRTEALFAGEPAGGSPNHYGDAIEFTLPHTGIRGRLSSRYHEESTPDDTRDHHAVDIPTPFVSEDYWSGHDPALEGIWTWRAMQR